MLQVGADVYCDTALILRELERRRPQPTLYPPALDAPARMIAYWAEHQLFRPMSLYVSGSNQDLLPPELQADRSRMRGLPIPDAETVARAARRNAPAVRLQIARIEALFADGRPWIAGGAVSIADFAVYHALWFIRARSDRLAHELAPYARIGFWMSRMASYGHGEPIPISAADALSAARDATPAAPRASSPFPEDPPPGARVRIRADDYARDPVEGELVLIDAEEIAIRRVDPAIGEVIVHFPRLGYDLRAL